MSLKVLAALIYLLPGTLGVILFVVFVAIVIDDIQSGLGYVVIVSLMIGPVSLAALALSSLSLCYELLRSCSAAGPSLLVRHPAAEVIGLCSLLALGIVVNLTHLLMLIWVERLLPPTP